MPAIWGTLYPSCILREVDLKQIERELFWENPHYSNGHACLFVFLSELPENKRQDMTNKVYCYIRLGFSGV